MKRLVLAVLFILAALPALAQNVFRIMPESGGAFASYLRVPPTYIDVRVLGVATNEDHTVPSGAKWVVFSANCAAFYVKIGTTAAVPAGDVTDGSGSELNPSSWYLGAASQLGIIAPATCVVTLSFYSLRP